MTSTLYVYQNYTGLLFRNYQFQKMLAAGQHKVGGAFDNDIYTLLQIPGIVISLNVLNQEVISKDNIAFRFSALVSYKITDIPEFMKHFELLKKDYGNQFQPLMHLEEVIHNQAQLVFRDLISTHEIIEINGQRAEIFAQALPQMRAYFAARGVEITQVAIKDVTLPKFIQELFAKQLESKIRALSDLENARTQVAAARALKNAAEMIKENPEIKLLQLLETLQKIGEKNNLTLVLGKDGLDIRQ